VFERQGRAESLGNSSGEPAARMGWAIHYKIIKRVFSMLMYITCFLIKTLLGLIAILIKNENNQVSSIFAGMAASITILQYCLKP
jgi:hypothetical protein